ncbi:MAG: nucleotidyltransferase domain-containing protein [Candidatus Lindowbacteria bacterium]|nr:nucleotidyltransferase domain-containing protein [Candidatus Lindowbacteria bacterium]
MSIPETPNARIEEFCRKWHITEFALFGSILREDMKPDSDVDVLVTFADDAQMNLYDWLDMEDELREIFGRDVDLVAKSGLRNPFRRHEILRTQKVIYASGV